MRWPRSRSVAVLGLVVAACLAASWQAQANGRTAIAMHSHLWLAITPSTTFDQAVLASVTGQDRAEILRTLGQMRSQAAAGKLATLPGRSAPTTAQGVVADLTALIGTLSAASADSGEANYPVRGYPGSGALYWTGMPLEIDGVYCEGVCITEDKLRANSVTTNPGAKTSKASMTLLYSPNNGDFTNIHTWFIALCYGDTRCGSSSVNGTGSKTWYASSEPAMYGSFLGHAYQLYAYFKPLLADTQDNARTGNALCDLNDNTCRY